MRHDRFIPYPTVPPPSRSDFLPPYFFRQGRMENIPNPISRRRKNRVGERNKVENRLEPNSHYSPADICPTGSLTRSVGRALNDAEISPFNPLNFPLDPTQGHTTLSLSLSLAFLPSSWVLPTSSPLKLPLLCRLIAVTGPQGPKDGDRERQNVIERG